MGKTYHPNFDLTLDECRAVLDAIGGLVIVDENGIIKYFSDDIRSGIEKLNSKKLPEKIVGKKIRDVHPTTKIIQALEEGSKDEIQIYYGSGTLNVTRILPVKSDGRIVGAVDLDVFKTSWELALFLNRIKELEKNGTIKLPETIEEFSHQRKQRIGKYTVADILGNSPEMNKLRDDIYQLMESTSTVLITGETGTGKEIASHALHNISGRQLFPFIEINCAAIPENLFEAEFFGYEEGTFTGAIKGGKPGIFEQANNGTLFLDEVDQIPWHMQPKLLRVLQEQEVSRIGGHKIPINVRIIAATNKDLKKMIVSNEFREDLYYRLNVVNIKIPPLREHKDDIPVLVHHRIARMNHILNRNIRGITPDALSLLCQYSWPGNVRELFNCLERAINMCNQDMLTLDHFADIQYYAREEPLRSSYQTTLSNGLEALLHSTEKNAIEHALRISDNNKTKAAQILGIARTSLHNKIKKYGIHLK